MVAAILRTDLAHANNANEIFREYSAYSNLNRLNHKNAKIK